MSDRGLEAFRLWQQQRFEASPDQVLAAARFVVREVAELPSSDSVEVLEQALACGAGDEEETFRRELRGRLGDAERVDWDPTPSTGRLLWTMRAILEGRDLRTPDSPRVTAWFLETDGSIDEVIVLGRGTTTLQKILASTVFRYALALPRDTSALLLDGLIWISPDTVSEAVEAELASNWSADERGSVDDALGLLKIELRELAERSALIELVTCSSETKDTLIRERLAALRKEVHLDHKTRVLVGPRETSETAAVLRVTKLNRRAGLPLSVEIPAGILASPAFNRLYEIAIQNLIRTIRADAQRRLDFYRTNLEEHRQQLEFYRKLQQSNDETRKRRIDEQVVRISSAIDFELGRVVALAKPSEMSGLEYYSTQLPNLIKNDEQWLARMERILASIEANLNQNAAGTRRLIAARFLDLALRDGRPVDDTLRPAFDDFRERVRPYLLRRVTAACEASGLDRQQLRGRRLVFGLATIRESARLLPYWVWSSATGVVELSFDGGLLRVVDLADQAATVLDQPSTPSTPPKDSSLGQKLAVAPLSTLATIVDQRIALLTQEEAQPTVELPTALGDREARRIAGHLRRAGAFGPALKLIFEQLAAQEQPAPEMLLEVLHSAAEVHDSEADPWTTIERWRRGNLRPHEQDKVVRWAVELAERVEPGYLERAIEAQSVLESETVYRSFESLQSRAVELLPLLRRRAEVATRVGTDLRRLATDGNRLGASRIFYRKVGHLLVEALMLGLPRMHGELIWELFDAAIGGQHVWDEAEDTPS